MTSIMTPDASITFIAALVIPLLIGFLVGIVAKAAIKIGIAVAVIVLLLIIAGIITPGQVLGPIVSFAESGPALLSKVNEVAGYLPYSSITFIVGLVIGFFKG